LAIVRALASRPSVLLLDEPFSSVDRQTKDSMYDLVREVSARVPGPIIYVTHHVDDAVSLADMVMTLEAGRLAPAERPWEDE
jgi:ABC-type nitrate/sulfonate/bicarbonate transport system ATPase subunit